MMEVTIVHELLHVRFAHLDESVNSSPHTERAFDRIAAELVSLRRKARDSIIEAFNASGFTIQPFNKREE